MFSGFGRCYRARLACESVSAPPTNGWRQITIGTEFTLVHLQRAIWLGCARKYAALLNAPENADMLITSFHYFTGLVNEVAEASVSEDYWKHMQSKVTQLEGMWRTHASANQKTK